MYRLNVSPEYLERFSYSIEKFIKHVSNEYGQLQQQTNKLQCLVDEITSTALKQRIQEIDSIIFKQCEKLNVIVGNVNAYADRMREILHKVELYKSTMKEKVCEMACGVVMHEHVKAVDSQYQTMDGYILNKTKSVINSSVSIVETVTGVSIKPQLVSTDEAHIEGQVDNAIGFIDNQIALNNPQKVIDRSGTPIPQEQIESHTLIVNRNEDLYKT